MKVLKNKYTWCPFDEKNANLISNSSSRTSLVSEMRFTFKFTNFILVVEKVLEWIHLTDGRFQELDKKTRCVLVGLMVWDKFNEATADIYTLPGYAEKVCSFL